MVLIPRAGGGAIMKCRTAIYNSGRRASPRGYAGCSIPEDSPRVETRHRAVRRLLAANPELITGRTACGMCGVSLKMLCRWIDAGLWPLPRIVRHESFFYKRAHVQCWIITGVWPGDPQFRERPECWLSGATDKSHTQGSMS